MWIGPFGPEILIVVLAVGFIAGLYIAAVRSSKTDETETAAQATTVASDAQSRAAESAEAESRKAA